MGTRVPFGLTREIPIDLAFSDELTPITTGVAKATFRWPPRFLPTEVRVSLTTAQGSGSIFTVDVNKNGTSILSTKVTVDNGEKASTTAATPAVISTTAAGNDDEGTVDVDQIGDGTATGGKVRIFGYGI